MKYVITTAQHNARPHKQFMTNLDLYCKRHKAELIILPVSGQTVKEDSLHPELNALNILTKDFKLNENIKISNYAIKPQQINPLTGIRRFAPGDRSFIFASPKQSLEYVPTGDDNIPKAIITTGACTEPNYNINNRIGRIATKDHVIGALAVDITDNNYFHFRHLTAQKNGLFFDIDGKYDTRFRKLRSTLAFVVGDLHPYNVNPDHQACTLEQILHFKPKDVFMHDVFNAYSISHHAEGHFIKQHQIFERQGRNLEAELIETLKEIKKYTEVTKGTVNVVPSNHDHHLYRYLDEGRFIDDKGNKLMAAHLYLAALKGYNPLEIGLKLVGELPPNLNFLSNKGKKIKGIELGRHGHLGANGARGSLKAMEEAEHKSITGHGHSAQKIRNTYKVGTSTDFRIGYNDDGFSNWSQTNAVVYRNGLVQLLNTVNKEWR